jgi:hypothetical protein
MKNIILLILYSLYSLAIFINIIHSNIILVYWDINLYEKIMLFSLFIIPSLILIYMYLRQGIEKNNINIMHSYKFYLYIVCIVLVTAFFNYLIIYPDLSRPINLFGDEDFHIISTFNYNSIIFNTSHFQLNTDNIIQSVGRYPGLHHFLASIVGSKDYYFRDAQFYLYFLFLGLTIVILLISRINSKLSIYLTLLLFLLSPLNITYFENYYIDLLIPFLVFTTLVAIYSYAETKDNFWLLIAIFSILITPFLRQHMLPTSIIFSLATMLIAYKNYHKKPLKYVLITLIFLTALFPLLFYIYTITNYYHNDQTRVFIKNIFKQDYPILILLSPIYIPAIIFLNNLFIKKDFFIFVALTSLFAQLLLYGMFEPGWMPWSRNYLSFVGQIFFLVIFINKKKDIKIFIKNNLSFILLFILIFISSVYYSKNNNTLFSENENRIRYDYALNYIQKNYSPNKKIFFQVPIAVPATLNFILDYENFNLQDFDRNRLIPILLASQDKLGNPYLFLNSLDCRADLALIHWRSPTSFSSAINYLSFEKFNASSNIPFRIVYEHSEPIHRGKVGLMIVERIEKCKN